MTSRLDDVGGWDSDTGAIIVGHLSAMACSVLRRIDKTSRAKWSHLYPDLSAVVDACLSASVPPAQRLARLNLAQARVSRLQELIVVRDALRGCPQELDWVRGNLSRAGTEDGKVVRIRFPRCHPGDAWLELCCESNEGHFDPGSELHFCGSEHALYVRAKGRALAKELDLPAYLDIIPQSAFAAWRADGYTEAAWRRATQGIGRGRFVSLGWCQVWQGDSCDGEGGYVDQQPDLCAAFFERLSALLAREAASRGLVGDKADAHHLMTMLGMRLTNDSDQGGRDDAPWKTPGDHHEYALHRDRFTVQHFSGAASDSEEADDDAPGEAGSEAEGEEGDGDDEKDEENEEGEEDEEDSTRDGLDANIRSQPWAADPGTDLSLAQVFDTADATLEASLWALVEVGAQLDMIDAAVTRSAFPPRSGGSYMSYANERERERCLHAAVTQLAAHARVTLQRSRRALVQSAATVQLRELVTHRHRQLGWDARQWDGLWSRMELASRPSEHEGESPPEPVLFERGADGIETSVHVRVWSPDAQETGYAAVFALEVSKDPDESFKGLVSVLSVDLTGRGRFEDLRVIHCDSAQRQRRPGAARRDDPEAFNCVPSLTPQPCASFRTAASDAIVREACSVLGLPEDMERSELMTVCRTMLLTYVATKWPTRPSHGAGCEWWQWAPTQY